MVQVLRDVPGEDSDEESRADKAHGNALTAQKDEREPERDFRDARCDDGEVFAEWQRLGHLRMEVPAREGQVAHAGENQERTEKNAACRFRERSLRVLKQGDSVPISHTHG